MLYDKVYFYYIILQYLQVQSNKTSRLCSVCTGNGTGPEVVSLKPGESTVLTFAITEADIGGTLAIEMAIIHPRVSI